MKQFTLKQIEKMLVPKGELFQTLKNEGMKNDYPITIKEAKRIAKARIGRLPRAGYSVVVGGVFNGLPPTRRWDYQLSLVNYSGKFWLLEYTRPFSNVKPSDFQSIENETDGRE
jgi:hypothetical protein